MRLTYWYAANLADTNDTSIIDKTKRGAQMQVIASGGDFLPVKKCTIEYRDAFHLLEMVTRSDSGRGFSNMEES